jgi:cyclic pyranopterin phosphate synthase
MPKEVFGAGYSFLKDPQLMTLEEIGRIAESFVKLGVQKIRLTGGEPLLRQDIPELVSMLKNKLLVPDVAITTNGWLLEKAVPALKIAGLNRLNVSVDSLDDNTAGELNGLGFKISRVLSAIDAACDAAIPVKINCVIQKGVNDHQIIELCDYFRKRKIPIRFIEFMDVGNTNRWNASKVVSAKAIVELINAQWPLIPVGPAYRGEVASRYSYSDGAGEIGLISSVTEPFCKDCHRARLSADGKFYTCLFASFGWDVLACLRAGADPKELTAFVSRIWKGRLDKYSDDRAELLASGEARAKIEMSYIGG